MSGPAKRRFAAIRLTAPAFTNRSMPARRGKTLDSKTRTTWTNVLFKDENTGGIDVVFDPHNPNIVYAALWQAKRQPWFFSSGGAGSGLYRSEENGVRWKGLEG